jgi:hypothetical protein
MPDLYGNRKRIRLRASANSTAQLPREVVVESRKFKDFLLFKQNREIKGFFGQNPTPV